MEQPVLSSIQAEKVDRYTIETLGISGQTLMKNAGHQVFLSIKNEIKQSDYILVICGSGNNGGDGFVVANYLFKNNFNVKVLHTKAIDTLKNDALFHAQELIKSGLKDFFKINSDSINHIQNANIIIDAILGTGFQGPLNNKMKHLINEINSSEASCISIDIPSGLDATSGLGIDAVNADKTIAIGFLKRGFYFKQGLIKTGIIQVVDIGFPKELSPFLDINLFKNNSLECKHLLPKRLIDGHKSQFGKALIIAGSLTMSGAALLSGLAALRSGAGLVKVAVPKQIFKQIDGRIPELMIIPVSNADELDKHLLWADSIAIGMGLGQSKLAKDMVKKVIDNYSGKLIIDADGLNLLNKRLLNSLKNRDIVLTPHFGEFSRLVKVAMGKLTDDLVETVRVFAQSNAINCLLKGKTTLISDKHGLMFIDSTGNSALATAGSGDVLSGLITGFAAQGLSSLNAARLASYLHGRSAEIGSQQLGEYAFIASDVFTYLPKAIMELVQNE